MRIVVITSCTGEKIVEHVRALTLTDFQQGMEHITEREQELAEFLVPAEHLYSGQQHLRLMRGVRALREQVTPDEVQLDLWILSAGYGLVPARQALAPYECTFQGMKKAELRAWADQLRVPAAIRRVLAEPYDLAILLLGDSYMEACALDASLFLGGPTLAFCGSVMARHLPPLPSLRPLVVRNLEAKRFSCGLVALKGELTARLLDELLKNPQLPGALIDPAVDILALLDREQDHRPAVARPKRLERLEAVDQVIHLPTSWHEKPHRARLSYFIPDWDDLVDPEYDFLTETHAGGMGDWANEIYAHQLYPEPNYDGILMSKVVAERSARKKKRINELGVHRYLRVPDDFPIMGDCGAFGYIKEEVPPYTTEEILEYYTRLGFTYGVSLDHLIVTATEEQKHFRYGLTLDNARDFITQHRQQGLRWTPIGAVQGWDAASYAKAARACVDMGYRSIALGGLARTNTQEILAILQGVHEVVPRDVRIHLFGIARITSMDQFVRLGVTSVDSASHLRRAWLGATDNYYALDGRTYAAIRVPALGKSFRAKRIVREGRADASEVGRLEYACMKALRAFDRDEYSVEATLDVLDEFDHLITPGRKSMRSIYRITLESRPWHTCPCAICQQDGIEVMLFRGNNRNRRRGFHNTYVFYRLLQQVLAGETVEIRRPTHQRNERQPSLFPLSWQEHMVLPSLPQHEGV